METGNPQQSGARLATASVATRLHRGGRGFAGWLGPAVIAGLQAILAWIGYLEATADFGISPVWPAAGFGLAMAILYGNRVLPALWLGMSAADLVHGNSLPVALWIGLAVAAGAGLGAWLVRRFVPRLGHADADWSEAALFLLLSAVGATAVTAGLGTAGLVVLDALPASEALATALTWWTGDGVGVITVAPFVLAWSMPGRRAVVHARPLEFGGLVLLTVAAAVVGFWLPATANGLFHGVPGIVLVLPFLVWSALRFGVVGAATGTLVIAIAVTSASVSGIGAFGGGGVIDVYRLQFLLGVVAATALLLGATASRRDFLQDEARRDAEFVRSIADNLPGAVFRRELHADGRVTYPYMAGRFAEEFELTGANTGHELDRAATERLAHLDGQDLARLHDELRESARTMEPFETELRFLGAGGDTRWVRSISRPHPGPRGSRDSVIWDGILLEVTEEKRQRAHAEYLARHDALTGLMNRAGLHEILVPALSRATRQHHSVAICIVDLDGFKRINDTHGHGAGDRVLAAIADRLRDTMRLEDIKARMGGDEFVVVQTDVQTPGAVEAACRRLAERLSAVVWHAGEPLYPRASIGVALHPEDGGDLDAVFAAADEAMYSAKSRGDGAPVFFSPAIGEQGRTRSRLTADLAAAIERRELEVYYQPQVHVATGRVSSVEALVRWCHPEHGWVSPARFVPLAEETGLVSGLDQLVLETVLADMEAWDERGTFDGTVAVNLSGASLRSPAHRDAIARLVEASGLPPGRLELELTETTLIHAADECITDGLRSLAALGVHFSADDFGTGYGSLTYLRALPITRIKIDRSFVQGAPSRVEDAEIIRALLQLAGNLGLHVVAEGVETAEELEQLRGMGCPYVQGFYFARPMPRAALEAYLVEHGTTEPELLYSGHLF